MRDGLAGRKGSFRRRWLRMRRKRSFHLRRSNPIAVIAIAAVIIIVGLVTGAGAWLRPTGFDETNEFLRTSAQLIGGTALLTGLVFTYLTVQNSRQILEHQKRAERNQRYFAAVEKLAHDNEGVRIGAAYALHDLANEMDSQRVIVGVLTQFLRSRAVIGKRDEEHYPFDANAVLMILGSIEKDGNRPSLQLQALDFFGFRLDDADFESADFEQSIFRNAQIWDCSFASTNFSDADFRYAVVDALFTRCNFVRTDFCGADLLTAQGISWDELDWACLDRVTQLPMQLDEKACVWRTRPSLQELTKPNRI